MSPDGTSEKLDRRIASTIRRLTDQRGPDKSICPSEAARAVDENNWRDLMDDVRRVAARLAKSGDIQITQGGEPVSPDDELSGAIRLRQAGA